MKVRRASIGEALAKCGAYLALGIPGYWVVDIEARVVSVFTALAAEPAMVSESLRWQPRSDVPALEIDLAALLR